MSQTHSRTGKNDERAVNTVIDVALALLFIAAAVALLSGLPVATEEEDHDPLDADRTAAVVGSSTLNVTYSLEPLYKKALSQRDDSKPEEGIELTRSLHGSMASLVGTAGVVRLAVGADEPVRLTRKGSLYETALNKRVQSRLVGSQFETQMTAVWVPYEGASFRGESTVGVEPPPDGAISTAELTVPSGMASVREEAVAAVADGGGYETVAALAARAIIEGYLPEQNAKHALERNGPERTLTAYRYERMATIIDDASPESETLRDALRQAEAEPEVANEYLTEKLTKQLTAALSAIFKSPKAAARSLSVSEVTVTMRTWEP